MAEDTGRTGLVEQVKRQSKKAGKARKGSEGTRLDRAKGRRAKKRQAEQLGGKMPHYLAYDDEHNSMPTYKPETLRKLIQNSSLFNDTPLIEAAANFTPEERAQAGDWLRKGLDHKKLGGEAVDQVPECIFDNFSDQTLEEVGTEYDGEPQPLEDPVDPEAPENEPETAASEPAEPEPVDPPRHEAEPASDDAADQTEFEKQWSLRVFEARAALKKIDEKLEVKEVDLEALRNQVKELKTERDVAVRDLTDAIDNKGQLQLFDEPGKAEPAEAPEPKSKPAKKAAEPGHDPDEPSAMEVAIEDLLQKIADGRVDDEIPDEYAMQKIDDTFGLTPKVSSTLVESGIQTVGELVESLEQNGARALALPGIGKAKANAIVHALDKYIDSFGDSDSEES